MLKLQQIDQPEKSVWLVGDRFVIGCSDECDLILHTEDIQGRHAEITIDGERLTVNKLEGECRLNGLGLYGFSELAVDDQLTLGSVTFQIVDPKHRIQLDDKGNQIIERRQRDSAGTGWLLQAEHPKFNNKRYPINRDMLIGRATDCDIIIPYRGLSRHHAELSLQEGELVLRDLNSSNGTKVNGQSVSTQVVHFGDRIEFANLPFTVLAPLERVNEACNNHASLLARTVRHDSMEEQSEVQDPISAEPLDQPELESLEMEPETTRAESKPVTDVSVTETVDHQESGVEQADKPSRALGVAAGVVGLALVGLLVWLFK